MSWKDCLLESAHCTTRRFLCQEVQNGHSRVLLVTNTVPDVYTAPVRVVVPVLAAAVIAIRVAMKDVVLCSQSYAVTDAMFLSEADAVPVARAQHHMHQ